MSGQRRPIRTSGGAFCSFAYASSSTWTPFFRLRSPTKSRYPSGGSCSSRGSRSAARIPTESRMKVGTMWQGTAPPRTPDFSATARLTAMKQSTPRRCQPLKAKCATDVAAPIVRPKWSPAHFRHWPKRGPSQWFPSRMSVLIEQVRL